MRAAAHVSGLVLLIAAAVGAAPPPSVDTAFQKFWSARNPDDAAKAAGGVVSSGVTVDAALARLKAGRPYSSHVKHGLVHLQRLHVSIK